MKTKTTLAILTLFVAIGSAGCERFRPCDLPTGLTKESLFGTWVAVYDEHWVSDPIEGTLVVTGTKTYLVAPGATPMPIDQCGMFRPGDSRVLCRQLRGPDYPLYGIERLRISADGTYTQTFASGSYAYAASPKPWALVLDAPEGPRLLMDHLRYFAAGIAWSASSVPLELGLQTVDHIRLQATQLASSQPGWLRVGIVYPSDQKVHLYPRMCGWQLSLVQMRFGPGDPDNLVTADPVFKKQGP